MTKPSPLTADGDLVLVLTTAPSADEARKIARAVVEERLAACVNVLPPMQSLYVWQGALCEETEVQCLIKTTRRCLDALVTRVQELHPYRVPEVVVLQAAEASLAYSRWVAEVTGSTDEPPL